MLCVFCVFSCFQMLKKKKKLDRGGGGWMVVVWLVWVFSDFWFFFNWTRPLSSFRFIWIRWTNIIAIWGSADSYRKKICLLSIISTLTAENLIVSKFENVRSQVKQSEYFSFICSSQMYLISIKKVKINRKFSNENKRKLGNPNFRKFSGMRPQVQF